MKLIGRYGHGRHEEFSRIAKVTNQPKTLSLTKRYTLPELVRLRLDFHTSFHAAFVQVSLYEVFVLRRKLFRGMVCYKFTGTLINE